MKMARKQPKPPKIVPPKRGFAARPPADRRAIAAKGGRASAAAGKSPRWDRETARKMGQKGGLARKSAKLTPAGPD